MVTSFRGTTAGARVRVDSTAQIPGGPVVEAEIQRVALGDGSVRL
jgi:hypothetical protein